MIKDTPSFFFLPKCGSLAPPAASPPAARRAPLLPPPRASNTADPSTSPASAAAVAAVAAFVRDGDVVAVGPGPLAAPLLAALAARGGGVRVLAAGDAPAAEAALAGAPQARSGEGVAVAFVCADEVDGEAGAGGRPGFAYVTGRADAAGAGAQPQLDRVAALTGAAARGTVALLPHPDRLVTRLGGDIPVLVSLEEPRSWEDVGDELDDIFLGDAEIWRRPSRPDDTGAGPRGGPTPHAADGATLLDVVFGDEAFALDGDAEAAYSDIVAAVEGVEGVRAHGLGWAAAAVVAGGGAGGAPVILEA